VLKRIGTVCLVATLLLSLVAGSCVADSWGSLGWSDNWKAQCGIPLPSGYESWHWLGGCDFGEVRGSRMRLMKFFRLAGDCSLAALVGYFIGLTLGGAWALEGAKQAALAKTSLRGAILGGPIFGSGLSLGGKSPSEWVAVMNTRCPTVEALEKQITDLRFKAGISDYYTFARAVAPNYTPVIAGGPEPHEMITVPLGARMKLRLGSSGDYYNLGYPPGEFRIVYDAWPRVIRLMTPTLDFGRLDARVWEMDITGKLQPTTVKCVFAYEAVDGKVFPLPRKGNSPGLSVQPDTPQKGGRIEGKVSLRYHPRLGETGLREVHLSSPVNQGVLSKKIDHHAFAIVINKRTVFVTPSKKELKVGDELVVVVKVKGFHFATESIPRSDGKTYAWNDWVGAILRGASLQGAGITETEMVHDHEHTLLKGTPREGGKVKLVLPTRDGPVVWEVATVEKEVKPAEVVEEKKERAQVTATIQEVVKTPVGWYYQVVIGVEGVRVSFTGREDWESYPDETHHYRDHWKSPLILKAGEKIVLAVQVVRFDRPVHDLIKHRIVWYGVDENHNEIELESVFSPSETGYKDWSE